MVILNLLTEYEKIILKNTIRLKSIYLYIFYYFIFSLASCCFTSPMIQVFKFWCLTECCYLKTFLLVIYASWLSWYMHIFNHYLIFCTEKRSYCSCGRGDNWIGLQISATPIGSLRANARGATIQITIEFYIDNP